MKSCLSRRHFFLSLTVAVAVFVCTAPPVVNAAPAPLRLLFITGGCCHDYARQKDILKKGLEERANVIVDQVHSDDTSTHPPLAILGNPESPEAGECWCHRCGLDPQ